jgi:hypothetical protein
MAAAQRGGRTVGRAKHCAENTTPFVLRNDQDSPSPSAFHPIPNSQRLPQWVERLEGLQLIVILLLHLLIHIPHIRGSGFSLLGLLGVSSLGQRLLRPLIIIIIMYTRYGRVREIIRKRMIRKRMIRKRNLCINS